jgi:lipopolysaccharide transport system ATP-binding protein
MSEAIIQIEGLGKRYRIGVERESYLSLRDEIAKRLSRSAQRARAERGEFWALQDVTFSVHPGEAIGIVGRNGAGKSTLLKILSRITPPTTGRIRMRGRVASLLEVGTGFHPELTGRENIFVNGAVLGMTRREIARKFDEIVDFAEVDRFLDTPVKRYSSGMYVRLAFAVAAHLEPEILVVDEVLAVGDAQYQRKCLGKMGDAARGGRTVLFVSHNMPAVEALCQKAVLLESGRVASVGPAQEIVGAYVRRRSSWADTPVAHRTGREGDGSIRVTEVLANGHAACGTQAAMVNDPLVVDISYRCTGASLSRASFHVSLWDQHGAQLVHCTTLVSDLPMSDLPTEGRLRCHIKHVPLSPGRYAVNVAAMNSGVLADRIESVFMMEVEPGGDTASMRTDCLEWGKVIVDHTWTPLQAPRGLPGGLNDRRPLAQDRSCAGRGR